MRLLIIISMMFGTAYSQCLAPTSLTVSNISSTGGRLTFTAASGATLYSWNVYTTYPSHTFATQGTTTATSFNFAGLSPSTEYRLQIVTVCGLSVSSPDSVVFTTPASTVTYTPMSNAGYQIKYEKVDSGFALPLRDTGLYRNVDRAGLLVYKPDDGIRVYDGSKWAKVSTKTNILAYPLRSDSISPDTSRIYIRQSWQDSALAGISLYNTFLVSTGEIILDTATSEVTVMDNIIFYENGVRDSITSPVSYTIPDASSGKYRIDKIYIKNGAADTVQGQESTAANLFPALPDSSIFVCQVIVFEDSVLSAGGSTSTSGSGSLQDAFDAAPTADPQINAHTNPISFDSLGAGSFMKYHDALTDAFYGFDADGVFELGNHKKDGFKNARFSFTNNSAFLEVFDTSNKGGRIGFNGENVEISAVSSTINNLATTVSFDSVKTVITNIDSTEKVGINTFAPTKALDVNGDTRFRANGTPASGKVPTGTDGNGNWTWQTPSGGTITDSLKIGSDWFFTKKITLTPTDINSGNSTPILAIPAPGTGKAVEIISASALYLPGASAYTADASLSLNISGGNTVVETETEFILSNVNPIGFKLKSPSTNNSNFLENEPVEIVLSADNTDGDGNIQVHLYFRIINL